MKNDGRNLQRLIHAIESARGSRTHVKIESPKRILDKITNELREHDVVLTYTHQHHEITVAIECRDRSRPVGSNAIEEFRSKCESTGIHSGIIVSSKGFSRPAIKKAAHYNIRCLTLEEIERVDWCGISAITVLTRQITSHHLYLDFPEGTDLTGVITREDGSVFDKFQVGPMAEHALAAVPYEELDGEEGTRRFIDKNVPLYMTKDGNHTRATQGVLTVQYKIVKSLSPFDFRKYADVSKHKPIADAAVATIPIGGRNVGFVLASQEDGTIGVSLVPEPVAVKK